MQADHTHLLVTLAHVLHAHVGKAHPHHQKAIAEALAPIGGHHLVEAMKEYESRHSAPGVQRHSPSTSQRT